MYKLLSLMSLLALSGCSSMPYDWHFECPEKKGKPCVRMSRINKMIEEEGVESLEESSDREFKCCQGQTCSIQKKIVIETYFPSTSKKAQKSVQEGDSGDFIRPVVEFSESPSSTFLRRGTSLYENGGIGEGEGDLPTTFSSQHEGINHD